MLQKPCGRSAMGTGIVTIGRLNRRGELDSADVSRFLLCLETEMKNTVDPFGKDAKNANFRLVDDRLIPFEFSCCNPVADLRSGYGEESATVIDFNLAVAIVSAVIGSSFVPPNSCTLR